jgi:hypothetical protein
LSVDGVKVVTRYGCINFHVKRYRGHGAKLTPTIKNKWYAGWTWVWFYCKIPLLRCPSPIRGKRMYVLHSSMAPLDFLTEPSFECTDDDFGDLAFIRTTGLIGGPDAIEEYLVYGMFPLSTSFSFAEVMNGETPVVKVTLPLPVFPLAKIQGESDDHFLARLELGAENVVGSYSRAEHNVWIQSLPNGGRLNQVFEKAGVGTVPVRSMAPRPAQRLQRKERLMLAPGRQENR